jgi:hypothetical protein
MHPEDPGSWRLFSYPVGVLDGKLRLSFELVSYMLSGRILPLLHTQRRQGQQALLWTQAVGSCNVFRKGCGGLQSVDHAGKERWRTGRDGVGFGLLRTGC